MVVNVRMVVRWVDAAVVVWWWEPSITAHSTVLMLPSLSARTTYLCRLLMTRTIPLALVTSSRASFAIVYLHLQKTNYDADVLYLQPVLLLGGLSSGVSARLLCLMCQLTPV
ncbi:hypothetical protein B484DRAFT_171773 [Ochromonadaceae sp. CCMP2298]|nr:hypothetical protein B484DRAFT_171773 [Ochromonadaceae sp. CCMP2298]